MKIILLGYGKMGKAIEKIALERKHSITARIDADNRDSLNIAFLQQADVIIEFSTPETAVENYRLCFAAQVPVVSGTTGWTAQQDTVSAACIAADSGFFYASNFSIGVFVFSKINTLLAKLMNKLPDYAVSVLETHHTQKVDAPSGTAITLTNQIIAELDRKTDWKSIELGKPDAEDLKKQLQKTDIPIFAARIDPAPGTHTINYDSRIDSISLTHTAHSREGFALGAVLAAEFMVGKKGVFGMNDLM